MGTAHLAAKAITIYQSVISTSAPVTVAGIITTNIKRDLFDCVLALGSIGSIIVGLFAVMYSAKLAKEADLNKRFLDILISNGEEKFQSLSMLIIQMNRFVQILGLGITQTPEGVVLSWNTDMDYHKMVHEELEKFNKLNSENFKYLSREMQAFVEIFRIKFDQIAINQNGIAKNVSIDEWNDLIIFQNSIVGMATPLLGLETNRLAMSVLVNNDSKLFYKYLNENSKKLKEYKITIEPAVLRFRSINENWRKTF
jgi:hypothetical protein